MDNHQNDRILLMDETEPWLLWVQDRENESSVCHAQTCLCEAEVRRKNDPESPYTIPTDPRLYIPTKTESGHEINLDDL